MADSQIRITADTSQAQAAIRGLTDRLNAIEGTVGRAQRSLDRMQTSLQGTTNAMKALAGAVVGASLFQFVDDLQNMQNKLRIATQSQQEFNQGMVFIRQIADATGQSISAVGDLYATVARNAQKLGYDTNQVATVTNAFATALKASGASAQGSASAIYQFSQILAKGKVNGDEFTTIMENLGGPVMDLVAKNMGVSTAELVKLKEQGLIGAKDFTDALIRSMNDLQGMSGKALPTLGQNLQRVQNAFADLVLKMDQATGASAGLANFMSFLAKNLDVVAVAAGTFFAIFAVSRIIAAAAAVRTLAQSVGVLGAALQLAGRSPLVMVLGALTAAATYFAGKKLLGDAPQEANDMAKAIEEANKKIAQTPAQLTGVSDKFRLILRDLNEQLSISGLVGQEYQVQQQVLQINRQLERQMTDEQRRRVEAIIRETEQRRLTAQVMSEVSRTMFQAQLESNRLAIQDLTLRAEQEAVDQRRLELKRQLTQQEEAQVRAAFRLQQANRETLAIEQARRQLLGEMTKIEAIQRGVGVQQRLDPMSAAGREYQMDMEALKSHLDAKLISEEEYQRQVLRLRRQYADQQNQIIINQAQMERTQRENAIIAEQVQQGKRIEHARAYAEFSMKTEAEKAQFALQAGAEMFSALGAQNKKAFEAAKAFNIANAIMNTYLAVTKAMATYPWPFSLIAAGAALASGMAQVAQIRSQNYSGRQLGGPVMGGQSYLVGEAGPEIFTPNTTGSITRNSDIGGGGPVNVTFNIVANDTSGFDDLLLSRRGLIRSVISDAMLESGRRG